MSINYVKQDLTTSDADYICHQVNCQGKMNSGVARVIREKWPIVFTEYMNRYNEDTINGWNRLLGKIQIINLAEYEPKTWPEEPNIINMFAQFEYGYDGKRYTSYDAFDKCLQLIKNNVPKGKKIAFPYKIGCDRGGAKWNVILPLISNALADDYEIEFCYLEADNWLKNRHYLIYGEELQ